MLFAVVVIPHSKDECISYITSMVDVCSCIYQQCHRLRMASMCCRQKSCLATLWHHAELVDMKYCAIGIQCMNLRQDDTHHIKYQLYDTDHEASDYSNEECTTYSISIIYICLRIEK
jgi:hypothetical protein